MPPVDLYDLRVAIAGPRAGVCRATYTLERRRPYPPAPAWREEGAILADQVETLAAVQDDLAAGPLVATRSPGDPAALTVLTQTLFGAAGGPLLAQLLASAPDPRSVSPWADPSSFSRLTLELGDPAFQSAPWERLYAPGTAADLLAERCAILRRSTETMTWRKAPEPLRLPLTIGVGALATAVAGQTGYADRLFDDFTRHARDLGGVTWQASGGPPNPAAIHHLIFCSAEAPAVDPGIRLPIRGGGYRAIGGGSGPSGLDRLRRVLQPPTMRGGFAPPSPRLLVLHDAGGAPSADWLPELAQLGLAQGAEAVLCVALAEADLAAGGLFPWFYRKLMHNWPVDRALLAALTEARRAGVQPLGWLLLARPGGELSVLLTRATVEAAQLPPTPKGPAPIHRGPAQGLVASADSRQERAKAELEGELAEARQASGAALAAGVDQAAGLDFSSEGHDVRSVVEAQERARQAAAAARTAQEVQERIQRTDAATVQNATQRLTNLWLTQGEGAGAEVAAQSALVAAAAYTLRLQISPVRRREAIFASAFPEETLRRVFERQAQVRLDVMFFAPDEDFKIEQPHITLELPRVGPSTEAATRIIPLRTGMRRLRACIYYHNVLLQSLLLEASVVAAGAAAQGGIVARTVDYVASPDLALLDELPAPSYTIFTNEGSDGSHWIGVFAEGDPAGLPLRSGAMHTFGAADLTTLAEGSRAALAAVAGAATPAGVDVYRLRVPIPLDAEGRLQPAADTLARREDDLVKLAIEGWILYSALFQSGMDDEAVARAAALRAGLEAPGIVSVARCRAEGVTIPWAALYRLALDTNSGAANPVRVCPLFRQQLAANRWSADGRSLVERRDLLDDPAACRGQAACPLNDRATRRLTVCPFGFWGFLHQVEQPLQQVKPTPAGQTPVEMTRPNFAQTSYLMRRNGVAAAMGVYASFRETAAHSAEMAALDPALTVECCSDRNDMLGLLESGGRQLYYFFCHGEAAGAEFKLKLGEQSRPGLLGAADLDDQEFRWRAQVEQPLVFLNGCETVALIPETINQLLGKLKFLGASGVIGTEIKVFTELAQPVGRLVVAGLVQGLSLGEAFLAMRRHLLRQYNPLGLAYTYHAPATLHFHAGTECAWCKAHPVQRRV